MDLVLSFWDTIDSPTFAPSSDQDLSNNFICAFEHPSLAPPRSPPLPPDFVSGSRHSFQFLMCTLTTRLRPPYGPHLCIASNLLRFSAPACASQFRYGEL